MLEVSKLVVSGLFVVGLLAGCGGEAEQSSGSKEEPKKADQQPLNKEEKPAEPKKDEEGNVELLEVGQKHKSEAGTGELLKIK